VSRAGARKFIASGLVDHISVDPTLLLDVNDANRLALGHSVATRFSSRADLLVELVIEEALDMSLGSKLAIRLAEALVLASRNIGGFAATGGEAASALSTCFGVNRITLVDEIEPGITLGLTGGSLIVPVAMKAGAFGNEDSLSNIASRLKAIRTEGRF
jgi:uncharacterized protein YgbK (DUF1537 family)